MVFGSFSLDKEKDILVDLALYEDRLEYTLRTPNHGTGNLITNLAHLCKLPLSLDEKGLKVIHGQIPCYVDDQNRQVYVFRLGDTKVANIYPDGTIERKAYIPAISKTLMSQTKDYQLDIRKTLVKTYILRDCKFRTDLHTHMNANLDPDILIALGIHHQIRYPLYYVKKLSLRLTEDQAERLALQRKQAAKQFADSSLTGKYLTRKIDDHTFINFADLILNNIGNAAYNLPRIRASLAIMKDGQAVFTNLEKVYLYRYVFTKGVSSGDPIQISHIEDIPDKDIQRVLNQMTADAKSPEYANLSLYENSLLWIARSLKKRGIVYAEISDTRLVRADEAPEILRSLHAVMPLITRETGVVIRFLAAVRRIPLTIVKDQIEARKGWQEQLRVIHAIASDPYVAGSDIIGEEMNDIRELKPLIAGLVGIAAKVPGFVIRIHAGENDSLRDNVLNSILCVRESLADGQPMPHLRIGHGLYTANLRSKKGEMLIRELKQSGAVLEFQITSNVRLNNLSSLKDHPLKQYLTHGVPCVQGTDGGAIYGTDSIDEQLALERLLELTHDEMLAMRHCEDAVLAESMQCFAQACADFKSKSPSDIAAFYQARLAEPYVSDFQIPKSAGKLEAESCLADRIAELPSSLVPVVIVGGSFNSDRRKTRLRPDLVALLEELTQKADPDKVFFVLGYRLSGYERELIRLANGRFQIFSIVPSLVTPMEARRLRSADVRIRVSIEPNGLGVYKSFAYEIFKRRSSVVLGLDGNSAGLNTIQEAKNGRHKARIFISNHARNLHTKAQTLQGYVRLFDRPDIAGDILSAIETIYTDMHRDDI